MTLIHLTPGPPMLTADLPEPIADERNFYGWPVLRLETSVASHHARYEHYESRTAYANWGDRQQPMPPVVILRTLYWGRELRLRVWPAQSPDSDWIPIDIPARFIWLPIEQLRTWVSGFEQIQVPVGDTQAAIEKIAIRHLRVDLNWVSNMFEKRWQARNLEHAPLNAYWEQVWSEMTDMLCMSTTVNDVLTIHEHSGWLKEKELVPFRYASDLYDPNQIDVTLDRLEPDVDLSPGNISN